MKKSLLAIAVISAATMASAEVKLSGDITIGVNSVYNIDTDEMTRPTFSEAGSELNIDATEDLGNGVTAYAHAELEFNGHNKTGGISIDEGRIGVKGNFGDLQIGDTGTACDDLLVGGGYEQDLAMYDQAGCYDSGTIAWDGTSLSDLNSDSGVGDQGIQYTTPDMNVYGLKASVSFHPGDVPKEDVISLGLQAGTETFKGSLGYSEYKGSDISTMALGLEGNFGDFSAGAQYSSTDYGDTDVDQNAWEVSMNYDLASGNVYGSYGEADFGNDFLSLETKGWMIGYTHNLSDRTWTWLEVGEQTFGDFDTNSDIAWSTGLGHKF